MAWRDFVLEVAGTDKQSDIARALEISQSTVSRWLDGAKPDSHLILAFADHYGVDRTTALIHGANLDDSDTEALLVRLGKSSTGRRRST